MDQGRMDSAESRPTKADETAAIACALPDSKFVSRAEQVIADFSQGLLQVEELNDGYALRFPGSEGWITRLVDFISGERSCCPFFAFELAFEPEGGSVWLRLHGAGVKQFLE
ncbi:MAG: hypothetical protein ACE5I4_09905, partial [Thermoplasmata archaeon]